MTISKLSLLVLLAFSSISFAKINVLPRVIYGIDDRMDVYESSDSLMKELSHSVAAQIYNNAFDSISNGVYVLGKHTLEDDGICSTEQYAKQVAEANCSGFLIGEDTLVTAGHCVLDDNACKSHSWVFDYANYEQNVPNFTFTNDQFYRCTKVINRKKENGAGADFAVVKLDRLVIGRKPLNIRKTGKVSNDAVLTVLGFPSGIPLKITTGAVIRDNTKSPYFVMNSDTYGGNSGSAVIDTKTGLVEGILVRGDTDYMKSPNADCSISVIRSQDGGRGEDATRITEITKK